MASGSSTARVAAALAALGFAFEIREFPVSTRTSAEAAAAIGCDVAQIAKSLVFRSVESARAVLVIASGANRVDERKLARLIGEKVERADADFVRRHTGFAIGGVPPVGLAGEAVVVLDRDLQAHDEIWAAAGKPNAVFRLSPADLPAMTGASFADLRKD